MIFVFLFRFDLLFLSFGFALNLIHQFWYIIDADREKLSRADGKFAQYLCKILDVYFSYHHDAYNIKGWFIF